ncbi:MAG: hypothetical protein PWP15_159 [Methanothermococcus sp.]|jgi:archaeosortase family protein ArtE|uniref:archaeosortase family protein ArtE n=1 Tax=Methanothermococcus TaxID=155862 RepID=UPI0003801EF7|nr:MULTISPECIES: archaeosortase family protein ArtE [Methanothermococcus]MDK2789652.1 hypothetical protein [Methanothermococcus sp.]MDK2988095.1 hypothetical protein [Methanothermococcus sp.]
MNKKELKKGFGIILKFLILSPIIYLILKPLEGILKRYIAFNSYIVIKIFEECSLKDNIIYLPNLSIEVIEGCTGITSISIYLAVVFITGKNVKEYFIGTLFGVIFIYFGNVIRIALIGILSNKYGNPILFHDLVSYIDVPVISVIATLIWFDIQNKMKNK